LNYKKAITLKPDNAKAHNNLGTALKKQCRLEEAEKSYNQAIELCHDYAEAHNNLGNTLKSLKRLDESITSYRRAIAIKPHYAEAHYNCGSALNEQKRFDEALIYMKRAIEIKPDYAEAHNILGATLGEQGNLVEAAANYSHAIELKPDYADAHLNNSFISLLKGDYKTGWQEYEWRLQTKRYALRSFLQPMWDGSPLKDKTILIHSEQGMGDNIQFVRYLPMVQAQGGRVIFECLPELVHLLKHCSGIDKIIAKSSSGILSDRFDVHVPLLSLPWLFDTTLDSMPSDVPYITADPDLIDRWRLRLNDDHKYKVGIVWAGNPDHAKDKSRSCSLSDFAVLAGTPGVSFYSLQKGPASIETDTWPDRN
ncbi:MAG: tetratricopeptide repeat protein, partial [Candidatus Scalindua sp.]|nr:tetratricopeptide repeat protein [Candidatus Scalindua sp.]